MGILTGKKILIAGIASERSIATGIADAMYQQGAELAFTYLNEKLKSRVEKVAERCGSTLLYPCDVASDEQIKDLFTDLAQEWPKFDGFVHAIGFAPKETLVGDYVNAVTREGFQVAHDISSYSFVAMAKEARPYLNEKSSLITLTYLGAERALPNYNVMGLAKASLEANVRYMAASLGREDIRVNAISAGPIRTLAAAGISNFRKMLTQFERAAAIKRCVTIEEVGGSAAFLASDLAAAVTGQVLHVDNGFSITTMPGTETEEE
ncbi:enoyl-ACP reductase FabI [Desulfotalea psychrophila]|uniref:Enoyl-[acyl-carrier-protein] reductase [NADH] n=1 Tax=Desulfotalea psychrophila (strain LSv54 / DSM 12343) TaxID=177439 RepID=Q6APG8_DESPS|nr:enoyl-ACP reductase [Desulfotalea psychrophila]CAG35756.1 probable enoyl-[acyl-carrier-protein] reductase [NADH] [Desulfotalea psychrophila LSv54]